MRRPARPAWEKKLWFWVTDTQYDHLIEENYDWRNPIPWREAIEWWVRENLIERPAKRVMCLVFGHYSVTNEPKYPTESYCIKCTKNL